MIIDPSSRPRDLGLDHYEAWTFYPHSAEKDITFLGIHWRIEERLANEPHYLPYGFAASKNDIENLISRQSHEISAPRKLPNATDWLFNLPDSLRQDVDILIRHRHIATKYDSTPRSWTLHKAFELTKKKGLSSWWRSTPTSGSRQSYLVILRCQEVEHEVSIPIHDINPFHSMRERWIKEAEKYHRDDEFEIDRKYPLTRHHSQPLVTFFSGGKRHKHKKQDPEKARQFYITQENAETLVNDFLASISTLYDGVSLENRRDVLDSVLLPTVVKGDEGSDVDSSDNSSDSSENPPADD